MAKRRGSLPAFGKVTGLVVNYSPDYAVRFDLDGNVVEAFERAFRIGHASFSLGGRKLSRGELDAIFGGADVVRPEPR